MNRDILTRAEVTARLHVSARSLDDWVRLKLVRPSALDVDKEPLFSETALERVQQLHSLEELGYSLSDLQRIIKKVGLPRERLKKKEAQEQDRFLTVGSLAEQSGVSPRTIKHWEDKGIIEPDRRSEGGFRLYSQIYVYLCKLIRDLQLFGYSLEEIKTISGYFRDFLAIQKDLKTFSKSQTSAKLETMLAEIKALFDKMDLFTEGIDRWQDLAKKKKKEILSLKDKNQRRSDS